MKDFETFLNEANNKFDDLKIGDFVLVKYDVAETTLGEVIGLYPKYISIGISPDGKPSIKGYKTTKNYNPKTGKGIDDKKSYIELASKLDIQYIIDKIDVIKYVSSSTFINVLDENENLLSDIIVLFKKYNLI